MSAQTAQQLMDFAGKNERLLYLRGRWQDEREYEDFAEYEKIIKSIFADAGFEVKKITKSFNITLLKDGIEFLLKVNMGSIKVSF